MKRGTACLISALAAFTLTIPTPGDAAGTTVRARFSFDALGNCERPAVQNFPVHAEGTATLSTDRTANLDMNSSVEGRVRYEAKLGGKPTEALGGSASVRVTGRHKLRAIREYANNYIIVDITVIGNACSLKIENRLKPGKRQYTFQGTLGIAYCSKPRLVHAECSTY
jgi:hypothetical protein